MKYYQTSCKLRRESTLAAAKAMSLLDAIDIIFGCLTLISEITNTKVDISVFNTDNRSLLIVHSPELAEE